MKYYKIKNKRTGIISNMTSEVLDNLKKNESFYDKKKFVLEIVSEVNENFLSDLQQSVIDAKLEKEKLNKKIVKG